jgi:hypothetical protein
LPLREDRVISPATGDRGEGAPIVAHIISSVM